MRQNSPFVRGISVCFLIVLCGIAAWSQTRETSEGSLHLLDKDLKETGLCPLKQTEVKADVSGFINRVRVTQTFQNPLNSPIEAMYTFPLPNDAAVDDMTIEIGNRIVRARILERREAKETYEKAKKEGKAAALLEQQRPNVFTQFVANITPGAEIKVTISYVETLPYADDTYQFTFPMTIGKRYLPVGMEPEDAEKMSVPSESRPGHTISMEINVDSGVPLMDVSSSTHEIETLPYSASKFTIRLKDGEVVPNRDFVLKLKTAGQRIENAVLAHYDDRGGFFTLILQPPDKIMPADAMPREIVFVMDTSGSMSGFPIEKAKESMNLSLDHLNPSDTFNLITFAGETRILFDDPVPATAENIARARKMLDGSTSSGGTEMMKAIRAALDPSDSKEHVRVVCFMTDGVVGNDREIIAEVQKHPNARVFAFGIGSSLNQYLLDEMAREGRGEVEYVRYGDDGSAAAKRFFERVRNPLLTDISVEFQGLSVSETYPARIPDLFDAKPVTITGRYLQGGPGKLILRGRMQGQPFSREIDIDLPAQNNGNDQIATLWARKKVAELTRQDVTGKDDRVRQAIMRLGLEYRLMTAFTSMVAVDEVRVTDGAPPAQVKVSEAVAGTPGGIYETVNVTGSGDMNATSSQISTTVTSQHITSLPVNGRSLSSLYLAVPGVQVNPASGTLSAEYGRTTVNGQRSTSNQFSVDGMNTTTGVALSGASGGGLPQLTAAGGTNSMVTLDSSQEFSVTTFASASDGRVPGGTFNVITKSGTNTFHGSLFETFGNKVLNAADPFARAKDLGKSPHNLNLFGGTLGGPFVKDRAFFFGNYEGMRFRQGVFRTSEVPSTASRLGASPDVRNIFNAFPVQNGPATSDGLAEFSSVFANPASHDIFGFKTDIRFTDRFHLSTRYNFSNSTAAARGNNELSLNNLHRVNALANSLSAKVEYTASANVVVSLQAAYTTDRTRARYDVDNFGGAMVPVSSTGSLNYQIGGRTGLRIGKNTGTDVDTFQTSGEITWISGSHDISFGGLIRRAALTIEPVALERKVLFSGLDLAGSAARINEIRRITPATRSTETWGVFGEDKWRISSRFTFTAGLRWDMDLNPDAVEIMTSVPNASTRMKNRLGNFAPRLSSAWDVTGRGKAVFRAGIGLYYDQGNLNIVEPLLNSAPYASGTYAHNSHFSTIPAAAFNPLALFANDLKTPRTWQIFTEYQQEIFRDYTVSASFVTVFGRDLLLSRNLLNADPVFNVIRFTDNSGKSDYQTLNFTVNRRYAGGASFNARYSWSRSTDNVSTGTILNSPFVTGTAADKGPSDSDARHTLYAFGAYDLPKFIKRRSAEWWARGWTVSGNLVARTAFPVDVTYTRVNDLGWVLYRPNLLTGTVPVGTTGGLRAIDPSAFSVPPAAGQGTLTRNAFRGFPLVQLNAALEKRFKLSSDASLQLKAEVFNVLNAVNYENMSGSLGTKFQDGTFLPNYYFGRTTATLGSDGFSQLYLYGGARSVQLSAKFTF